jgi:hypothetical protein
VLERDAERLNAGYVVDPLGRAEDFLRVVQGVTGEVAPRRRRSVPPN